MRRAIQWVPWLLLTGLLAACATSPPIRDHLEAEAASDQALALMNAGKNAQAVKLLDQVINYNGGEVRDLDRRATAYAALGQYVQAVQDLDQAVKRDPYQWDTYLLRGVAHQKMGDLADAVRDFAAAREIKPEDADLVRQQAYAELLAGEFSDAARDYERLAQLTPDSDIGPFGYGIALYLAGDWTAAASSFDAQLRKSPSDGIVALWLAKASLEAKTPLAWEQFADQAGPEPEWIMVRDLLSVASIDEVTRDMAALQTPKNGRRKVGDCEAALFIGAWAESRGLDDRARAKFDTALTSCPDDSIEKVEARTALTRWHQGS